MYRAYVSPLYLKSEWVTDCVSLMAKRLDCTGSWLLYSFEFAWLCVCVFVLLAQHKRFYSMLAFNRLANRKFAVCVCDFRTNFAFFASFFIFLFFCKMQKTNNCRVQLVCEALEAIEIRGY